MVPKPRAPILHRREYTLVTVCDRMPQASICGDVAFGLDFEANDPSSDAQAQHGSSQLAFLLLQADFLRLAAVSGAFGGCAGSDPDNYWHPNGSDQFADGYVCAVAIWSR